MTSLLDTREVKNKTDQVFQACQAEREKSLPPLNLSQFDSKELLKLSGFSDRESSFFSEYSDHWRDQWDQWEWGDECYYEGDFKCENFDEPQDQHGTWYTGKQKWT